jgi:transcription termination factor Rho
VGNDKQPDDDLATFDFEGESKFSRADDDFGAGLDDSLSNSSPGSSDVAGAESQQSTSRRRRKRRRRARGNGGEVVPQRVQNKQQGGHHGHQQNRGRNRQRQRRSKFMQNAPPSTEVAVTSGVIEGVLELHPKGYGFLRDSSNDYGARETDPFVSSSFVEKHHLREGIRIRGEVGPGIRGQGPRLLNLESIDGRSVEEYEKLKHFDTLTPINPFEQIRLETGQTPVTMRVMDLLTPIGKGQRALIVAPPRTGKTMLLQDIANSVSTNHPEVQLIVLLIDERPEEVTEMRRKVRGEVIASSMDRDVESHVRISQLIVERGKRMAEAGKDAFILLDSITRTARAFNKWVGNSGKTGTGGLDVKAMDIPRKMFGTARRFDEGGSLTVVATALIDTGSRMDEAIFQEFKGTGNMELVLSRDLADRRIWPSIDITKSGTRREEMLLPKEVLDGVIMLRRSLVSMSPVEAMEQLIKTLQKFPSNKEFLERIRNVL